ncbi:MAG: hypothetical protein HY721_35520 [Planctomycetes bacterium]|nr:hypothetical protein [Planctomycetota bacterium]
MIATLVVAAVAAAMVVARMRPAATQEAAKPRLFAMSYGAGHELAGFAGRPMLLVFGDAGAGGWSELLGECEADPRLAKLLSETFQGVFVDLAAEKDACATYGDPPVGTVLVKDLHGPLRGILEGQLTCEGLLALLEQALPLVSVEKSPAYLRLLEGTDVLDELVEKRAVADAAAAVRCLRHFEPGSEAARRADARAVELGLSP